MKEWAMFLLEEKLQLLEDKLGFYTDPSDDEIITINKEKIKTLKLIDAFRLDKPIKKALQKWAIKLFDNEINDINDLDYMDENIDVQDRVDILSHLDNSRRIKKLLMGWKTC